jgi:hypothetical protein|tara:strand:+ start:1859 stop:1984 length:126 start_codon:yes stop_codon:yes gene_type:complete
MIRLGVVATSVVIQTARLARDAWNKITDTWNNESRKWEDIV